MIKNNHFSILEIDQKAFIQETRLKRWISQGKICDILTWNCFHLPTPGSAGTSPEQDSSVQAAEPRSFTAGGWFDLEQEARDSGSAAVMSRASSNLSGEGVRKASCAEAAILAAAAADQGASWKSGRERHEMWPLQTCSINSPHKPEWWAARLGDSRQSPRNSHAPGPPRACGHTQRGRKRAWQRVKGRTDSKPPGPWRCP